MASSSRVCNDYREARFNESDGICLACDIGMQDASGACTVCRDACSECVWWHRNGDGSQRICDICPPAGDADNDDEGYVIDEEGAAGDSLDSLMTATTLECDNNNNSVRQEQQQREQQPQQPETGTKRKYISIEEFNKKSARIVECKWRELIIGGVYRVKGVHSLPQQPHEERQLSKYAELVDISNNKETTAWLPGIVNNELTSYNATNPSTDNVMYIQPLGMKTTKDGFREYHNFRITTAPITIRMTVAMFNDELNRLSCVKKWRDLSEGSIFYINGIHESRRNNDSFYAELHDIANNGRCIDVWLPKLISNILRSKYNVVEQAVYIRPLGLKKTKDGNRSYHNFDIAIDSAKTVKG